MFVIIQCVFVGALFAAELSEDCPEEEVPLTVNFLVALNATLDL